MNERNPVFRPPMSGWPRDVFSARMRERLQRETHVVVGDHQPEPRWSPPARPKVRVNSTRNKEETARLQAAVDDRIKFAHFAPSDKPKWLDCQ